MIVDIYSILQRLDMLHDLMKELETNDLTITIKRDSVVQLKIICEQLLQFQEKEGE